MLGLNSSISLFRDGAGKERKGKGGRREKRRGGAVGLILFSTLLLIFPASKEERGKEETG